MILTTEDKQLEENITKSNNNVTCSDIAFNMRELLARKVSNVIWGKGFIFNSENENIKKHFKIIDKNNQLLNFFAFCERQLSKIGRVIVTLNKTNGGNIMLSLGVPNWFNGVGRIFINEELAVVYQRIKIDQTNYVIKSTYDTQKCINEVYDNNETMLVLSAQIPILKELKIEKVWNHNLGICPVRELINIPVYFFQFGNNSFEEYADWFPARQFEALMFDTYQNTIKELNYCHSRIGIEDANQDLLNKLSQDINSSSSQNFKLSDLVIQTDVGGKINAIPGVSDLNQYSNMLNSVMDLYFKFSNFSRFSDGGGAQKTTSEANSTKDNQMESANTKIKFRELQYSKLIHIILLAYGVVNKDSEDYDFTFQINGNLEHNESALIDNVVKQINIGTLSITEAISLLRNIGTEEATKAFENIKKFNEDNEIMTSNSLSMGEEMNVGGNDGGRPPEDKQDKPKE